MTIPENILDYISKFGNDKNRILDVYKLVKSYEDLIYINGQFLQGKMCRTYYFYNYFGSPDTTSKSHAQACLKDLVSLNEKGIYTIDGQDGIVEKDYAQRSYLEFVCSRSTFKKIYPILRDDDRIYCSFAFFKEGREEQIGYWEDTNLTYSIDEEDEKDEFTNWWVEYYNDYLDSGFENIDNILKDEVYGMIFSKDYNLNQVDKILLEYI